MTASAAPPPSPLPDAPAAPVLLLVSDDLIFPSRIREGAKPLGYVVRVVAGENALAAALTEITPAAILVNLTARRYDPLQIITFLKANPAFRTLPVLAFAGHVEKEKHEAARVAGADMVAANSSVSLHLAALLPRLLQGERTNTLEDLNGDEA